MTARAITRGGPQSGAGTGTGAGVGGRAVAGAGTGGRAAAGAGSAAGGVVARPRAASDTAAGEIALSVDDLAVEFAVDEGTVRAVRGVSFTLRQGESLGIVGESGSGKSVTSLAVMGLLPKTARVSGSARLRGRELLGLDDAQISEVRGSGIAMVFQDPSTSLNPVYTVGRQIAEAVLAHQQLTKAQAMSRAVELLEAVGIPYPKQRVHAYPHELSGGMRQRVVIAIAMANQPDVIIADEPTTALDVTVQAQVLEAMETARRRSGAALALITHDLGVVAGHVDRVAVMYAGRVVEVGPVDEVFYHPRMPYTLGLLGSQPRLDRDRRERLIPIKGSPPSLLRLAGGCPFVPRCPLAADLCREREPELLPVSGVGGHAAACHFHDQLQGASAGDLFPPTTVDERALAGLRRTLEAVPEQASATEPVPDAEPVVDAEPVPDAEPVLAPEPVLAAEGLVKHFPVLSKSILRRRVGDVHAVCDVSLQLYPQQTLGLVGESGCGKSTTARLLLNLIPATAGKIWYEGSDLVGRSRSGMRPVRRQLQIVFQDPYASLDPRMTVFETVAEPLRVHGQFAEGGRERVNDLLRVVGLSPEHRNRYPHEFSGGQRQRIGIARALALRPRVLVLDEPVSALDVSIQAGIINLLEDLQDQLGLSYLFVSHDLSVVRHIAHRVAVMYLGRIVEVGDTEDLFAAPAHPYTQALISAVPLPDPIRERNRERILVSGDVPSPVDPPSGCRFRTRCPTFADRLSEPERELCVRERPELVDRGHGHPSACHYPSAHRLL